MRWVFIVLLAVGILLRPDIAEACDDGPYAWQSLGPAFAAEVPADGVLAFFSRGGESILGFRVEVRPPGGQPLAGAIERSDTLILWRPALPLEEGEAYSVLAQADNSYYGDEDVEWSGTVTASAPLGSLEPEPRWDAITVRHWVDLHPSTSLEDLVCCEGSFPAESYCGSSSAVDGCAPTRGTHRLHAELTIEPAARAQALGQLHYADFDQAENQVELVASMDAFPCVVLRATDLITGEPIEGPTVCPEPKLENELGEVEVDPRKTLICERLQICEIEEIHDIGVPARGWDPEDCRVWPEQGCGCVASSPQPVGALMIVFALLALVRGRRRDR